MKNVPLSSLDLAQLIAALSQPRAYAHPIGALEVHQTHISVVFLAGPFAYKIKKPVDLGFLDFSTLEKRKHFCEEEIRLNRRLAAPVYLGVVPVTSDAGVLRFGGSGDVAEWAVQMKRLPNENTLEHRIGAHDVGDTEIASIGRRIAAFHAAAESSAAISSFGRFAVVAKNARDNFTQTHTHVGHTVHRSVYDRVRALTEAYLQRLHDRIEARAARNVPRDTHGDLRLDHVYLFPQEAPPNDLLIIDCIEFSDRFRYADPVADMAFLAMDLKVDGRRDLARVLADAYFAATRDDDGRPLLPYYVAYRAMIRAKVEGIKSAEPEIDAAHRRVAQQRARAHWLLALGELEEPARRPALVLMAGLPGSGKSTLARSLAEKAGFQLLRSDVIRKEIAGDNAASAGFNEGIYSPEWTTRTYAELWARAETILSQGGRAVVDANFREAQQRQPFHDLALQYGVPFLFVHCETTPEVTHARLQARRGDASDADWDVYQRLAQSWQPAPEMWRNAAHPLDTSGSLSDNEQRLLAILRQHDLLAARE